MYLTVGIIKAISMLLGVLAPITFVYVIRNGINQLSFSPAHKKSLKLKSTLMVLAWVIIVWALTLTGSFEYQEDDIFPRFLIALFAPVLLFLGLFTSKDFKEIADNLSLPLLVGGQFWRVFGIVFFFVVAADLGPKEFIGSGYGDLITGSLAIIASVLMARNSKNSKKFVWLFTFFGMMDLMIVLFILLVNYPIWSNDLPNTAASGAFPLMLILGIAAPIALIQHILTLRRMLQLNKQA